MVYIIMDYDCVKYAGTNYADARKKVMNGEDIDIWEGGKLVGNAYYDHKLKRFVKRFYK